MKIKSPKQIIICIILFLLVAASGAIIFINKDKLNFNADTNPSATLSFSGGGAKTIGDTFNVSAILDSGGNKICVVNFDITYPSNLLELKSSSLGSPFSMAVEQSSSPGAIHYQIGASGCSTSNATILTMSFNAVAVGDATVAFSAADLLGGDDGQLVISVNKGSMGVNIAAVSVAPSDSDNGSVNQNSNTGNTNVNSASKTTKKTTSNSNSNASSNTNSSAATTPTIKDPVLSKVEYSPDVILDSVQKKAKGVAFYGTADPDNKINIVISSDPILASTQSDAAGNWTYTLNDWLIAGVHTIALISEKDALKSIEVKSNFVIGAESKDQIAIGTILPTESGAVVSEPAADTTKSKIGYMTIIIMVGGIVALLAIVLLMIFISKRRHYLKVAREITGSIKANTAQPHEVFDKSEQIGISDEFNLSQAPKSFESSTSGQTNPVTDSPVLPPEKKIVPPVPIEQAPNNPILTNEESVSSGTEGLKEKTGNIAIGYDQNPKVALQNQVAKDTEVKEKSSAKETILDGTISEEINKTVLGQEAPEEKVSDGSEITFDGDYNEEDTVGKDNSSNTLK